MEHLLHVLRSGFFLALCTQLLTNFITPGDAGRPRFNASRTLPGKTTAARQCQGE
ncbi:hypothetical protein ACNFH5_15575 [Pseudomonas sp. NY15435]|uniref:hypothetical protein n=1 Tax=Pseudomonas sp. NY15435 TaxID=3400358 RepID=UPI003A87813A